MAPSAVPLHSLGKNGPKLPAMGFGTMGLSHAVYGSVQDDEERFKVLDRALEIGATFWDTSDLYGDGEELIGKWFKRTGKRDQIFLASKFGYVGASKEGQIQINSSPEHCLEACEKSLKDLGVDCIDLYYMHHPDKVTPIEKTMRALVQLKAEGKIKYIGLSMISSNTLRRAMKIGPVDAVQIEYSVFNRIIEGDEGTNVLATCREFGCAVVCSSPLGRGMLTSTFSKGEDVGDAADQRKKVMPRFVEQNRDHNTAVIKRFSELADKKGCTVTQLSLAWLLKQGDDIFPIPGTKRINYLEQNWASLDIKLTDQEEAEIRSFADSAEIKGGVVPDAYKDMMLRDTPEEK